MKLAMTSLGGSSGPKQLDPYGTDKWCALIVFNAAAKPIYVSTLLTITLIENIVVIPTQQFCTTQFPLSQAN